MYISLYLSNHPWGRYPCYTRFYTRTLMLRDLVTCPVTQRQAVRTEVSLIHDLSISCLKLPLIFLSFLCDKVSNSLARHTGLFVIQATFLLSLSLGTLSSNQSEFCTVSWKYHTYPFIPSSSSWMFSFSLAFPQVSYAGKLLFSLPSLPSGS